MNLKMSFNLTEVLSVDINNDTLYELNTTVTVDLEKAEESPPDFTMIL